jgi:hypothetical protein
MAGSEGGIQGGGIRTPNEHVTDISAMIHKVGVMSIPVFENHSPARRWEVGESKLIDVARSKTPGAAGSDNEWITDACTQRLPPTPQEPPPAQPILPFDRELGGEGEASDGYQPR